MSKQDGGQDKQFLYEANKRGRRRSHSGPTDRHLLSPPCQIAQLQSVARPPPPLILTPGCVSARLRRPPTCVTRPSPIALVNNCSFAFLPSHSNWMTCPALSSSIAVSEIFHAKCPNSLSPPPPPLLRCCSRRRSSFINHVPQFARFGCSFAYHNPYSDVRNYGLHFQVFVHHLRPGS